MVERLYLVVGEQGEHSDYDTWVVASYSDRERAEQHAALAQEENKRLHETYKDTPWNSRPANSYDSDPGRHYAPYHLDRVEYSVVEVPHVRHVDEFLEDC